MHNLIYLLLLSYAQNWNSFASCLTSQISKARLIPIRYQQIPQSKSQLNGLMFHRHFLRSQVLGLFTREIQKEGKASKTYQTVVFQHRKVPWTTVDFLFYLLFCFLFVIDYIPQWPSLEAHTAPYTLSLKSNGSIILIAALTASM